MKTLRTVVLVLVACVVMTSNPSASGLVGIYGIIERVVVEGTPNPERVQVWGAFAYANGGVGNVTAWSPVTRGYLYFRLPGTAVATPSEIEMIKREWTDLRSVAGTGEVVAFGRWGYIGRFETLLQEGKQPMFLERAPQGGAYTDLRVRAAAAEPEAPAAYHTNFGVVRIPADGSHADLVKRLRAALPRFTLQTGPPVAAMPDPANPGQKKLKNVAFVVRSTGCADVASFRVTAEAHVAAGGTRRPVALKVLALPSGVFALEGQEPPRTEVVSVTATCGAQAAGAVVRLVNGVYHRDAVELLPHHPAQADIDRAFGRPIKGGTR